jgi:hypothetical protein
MLKLLREMQARVAAQASRDRRNATRLDKLFPVWIEGDGGGGLGIARNISEGGMFVETRSPHPLGTQVRITFPADGVEMTAVGEVRYVCHLMGRAEAGQPAAVRGMGVRFLYFDPHGIVLATVH